MTRGESTQVPHLDAVLMYPIVVADWERMGFTDSISDQQRIQEVTDAIHSINKFITAFNKLIENKDREQISKEAKAMAERDQFKADSRVNMIIAIYKRDILNQYILPPNLYEEEEEEEEVEEMEYTMTDY